MIIKSSLSKNQTNEAST